MAPIAICDDYYAILEVDQNATPGEIIKSYKRLALIRHPDRNKTHNATETFQLLAAAFETLKDESKRREYDIKYPQIKGTRASANQAPQTHRPTPDATKSNEDDTEDAASISSIRRAKQVRLASWSRTQKVYDDKIFELRRDTKKLQGVIRVFEDIEQAERAEEADAKSWSTWLLSPLYRKPVETEEEKERKRRDRLQRLHSKYFKERDLGKTRSELEEFENRLRIKRQEFDAANSKDDVAISVIETRIRARRERERQEKERVEKMKEEERRRSWQEQFTKTMRERANRAAREHAEWQEKQAAERKQREQAQEAARKEQAEEIRKMQKAAKASETSRSSHTKLREERERPRQKQRQRSFSEAESPGYFSEFDASYYSRSTTRSATEPCRHHGWWAKVEGRRACENCFTTYGFLLQCPECNMKACASCRSDLRPPRRDRYR